MKNLGVFFLKKIAENFNDFFPAIHRGATTLVPPNYLLLLTSIGVQLSIHFNLNELLSRAKMHMYAESIIQFDLNT